MESYVWIQTKDGLLQQIEKPVAKCCPIICREIVQNFKGFSKQSAVSLPPCVTSTMLGLILDYCRFYQITGRPEKVWNIVNSHDSFFLVLRRNL